MDEEGLAELVAGGGVVDEEGDEAVEEGGRKKIRNGYP